MSSFFNRISVICGSFFNLKKSAAEVHRLLVERVFLRIVTGDEKWIHYDNLKKKKSWGPVETPFVISTTVGHVPLPPKGYEIKTNDIAIVSGWGRLWQGGPTTVKLQRVNIFIADRAYCRYMYNQISYNIYATQVCAYDASIEKGSCHGDSGGPLTIEGKLIGLVSWANGCASTTYPTVYTSVVAYLDWIKSKAV
ncbi:Mite allergen Der f 3 [Cyphomyrmex costatus]|uniref:Mite allergen Der f 3 n=1 Tax=Cyphomyrmex costatus TaxID=456900 RepID=A0A151IJD7_9HYME|nr:Mite allergen Der f 3 [Cyphomyrmex costatus]